MKDYMDSLHLLPARVTPKSGSKISSRKITDGNSPRFVYLAAASAVRHLGWVSCKDSLITNC